MSGTAPWRLVVTGLGTAGMALLRALLRSPAAAALVELVLVDYDTVSDRNFITCPDFSGKAGRPKPDAAAECCRSWLAPRNLPITALWRSVQSIRDWARILAPRTLPGSGGGEVPPRPPTTLLAACLDDWGARLFMVESARMAAHEAPSGSIVSFVVGLERDAAVVWCLDSRFESPCPVCATSGSALPAREPCVLYQPDGQLLRGNLRREARAAGDFVAEAAADCLVRPIAESPYLNTKTSLLAAAPGDEQFTAATDRRTHIVGCYGPHSTDVPRLWDRLRSTAEAGPGLSPETWARHADLLEALDYWKEEVR